MEEPIINQMESWQGFIVYPAVGLVITLALFWLGVLRPRAPGPPLNAQGRPIIGAGRCRGWFSNGFQARPGSWLLGDWHVAGPGGVQVQPLVISPQATVQLLQVASWMACGKARHLDAVRTLKLAQQVQDMLDRGQGEEDGELARQVAEQLNRISLRYPGEADIARMGEVTLACSFRP